MKVGWSSLYPNITLKDTWQSSFSFPEERALGTLQIKQHTWPSVGEISFSDSGRCALLYFSRQHEVEEVLAWDLDSYNICIADSAILKQSTYISCFLGPNGTHKRINYKGYDVFPIRSDDMYAASGNHLVLAKDDRQFTVINFNSDRIGET